MKNKANQWVRIFINVTSVILLASIIVYHVATIQTIVYFLHRAADEMWMHFSSIYDTICQIRNKEPSVVSGQIKSYDSAMEHLWVIWRLLYLTPLFTAITEAVIIVARKGKAKLRTSVIRILAVNVTLQILLYPCIIYYAANVFSGGVYEMPGRRW